VGRHERCFGELCYVPESSFIQVREVDQGPKPVALLPDELLPCTTQARTCVRRGRKPERDAVGVDVGPAPHESQRPEARLVKFFERARVRAQVLGALEVQDGSHDPFAQALFELLGRPNYP
jgi:hypothetical protein